MYKLKFFLTLFIVNCSLLIVNAQHIETDTLTVDSAGVAIDSTDLNQKDLLAVEFPASMTSDTVFIKTKNLATGTFKDAYYTDNSGEKKRVHVVVEAGAIVSVHPIMSFFLGRYIYFVPDDVEAADRTFIVHKGKI